MYTVNTIPIKMLISQKTRKNSQIVMQVQKDFKYPKQS